MAEGHRFAPAGLPRLGRFYKAVVAQLVERVLGKDEVTSSILVNGSRDLKYWLYVFAQCSDGKAERIGKQPWRRKNLTVTNRT